jgi:hypothetical protein
MSEGVTPCERFTFVPVRGPCIADERQREAAAATAAVGARLIKAPFVETCLASVRLCRDFHEGDEGCAPCKRRSFIFGEASQPSAGGCGPRGREFEIL